MASVIRQVRDVWVDIVELVEQLQARWWRWLRRRQPRSDAFESHAITPWLTGGSWVWAWSPWVVFFPLTDAQKVALHRAVPDNSLLRSLRVLSPHAAPYPLAYNWAHRRIAIAAASRGAPPSPEYILERCKALKDPGGEYASDAAVESLAEAIKATKLLRRLVLQNHRIHETAHLRLLLAALSENTSLVLVDLRGNGLADPRNPDMQNDEHRDLLKQITRVRPTLRVLL
ncbi:hypothetical protein HK405_005257 [Cladochytrium tenue]|nr:hypothetical protein HK405_005257 [Cladochytrium tenue]